MNCKQLIFGSIAIILLSLFNYSCRTRTSDVQLDSGEPYFPLKIGKYIIYDVDSITYDFDVPIEQYLSTSRTLQVKESITDTFIDNTGQLTFEIKRFERDTPNDMWQIKDVWLATRTRARAEKVEDNLRFVKMSYPLKASKVWDGNAYIDDEQIIEVEGEAIEMFKNWVYEYQSLHEPYTMDVHSFDSVLTIIQADEDNLIERRYSLERYAKNVGLIYKELIILDTQCIEACSGQSWEDKAEKGFIMRMRIADYN